MADQSNIKIPLAISGGIHIGAIIILAIGLSFDEQPKNMPSAPSAPAIQAVMVDQQKISQHVEKLKQQKQEAENKEKARQAELERKALEARKNRELEQQRIKNLEIERKQKEIETQKANDAAKAAQIKVQQEKERAQKAEAVRKQKEQEQKASEEAAQKAAEKRKQEEAAAKKAEEERKRKAEEDERKRKAEAERQRKAKAEADAKARQEQEMADALADEQAALSQTRNKQVMSEVDRFRAMISATIQRNLVVDESMRGKSCRVFIRLAQDGFVTSSQTLDGDQVVCRAAKAAINKAGRLPVSTEAGVYDKLKEINLTVSPEFN